MKPGLLAPLCMTLVLLALTPALPAVIPGATPAAWVVAPEAPAHQYDGPAVQLDYSPPMWMLRASDVAADRVVYVALAPAGERRSQARIAAAELEGLAFRLGVHPDGAMLAGVIQRMSDALQAFADGRPGALAQLRAASAARMGLLGEGE